VGRWDGGNRVESRAAAEVLVECLAEVAEAGVADLKGGLGHVESTGTEEFGAPFEADLAQELLDGHAHLGGEGAAEVERAATDDPSEFFERRGFRHSFTEQGHHLLDASVGDAFGAGTEQFLVFWRLEKEVDDEFDGFGAVPEHLGFEKDGGIPEAGEEFLMAPGQRDGGSHGGRGVVAGEDGADDGVEPSLVAFEVLAEERSGKFDSNEGVTLVGASSGFEGFGAASVEACGAGADFDLAGGGADGAFPGEVEADFDASLVEGAAPIDLLVGVKVVPFEAESVPPEAASELFPFRADGRPELVLLQSGWGCGRGGS